MHWEELLEAGRVERRTTGEDEVQELLAAMRRQLENASVRGLTPDGRLQHIFSAVRMAATVAIRAEGYRTRGMAHHETTFLSLEAIGPPLQQHAAPCQALRYLRIDVEYSGVEVTRIEAQEALEAAITFLDDLRGWLQTRHPELGA